MPEWESVNTGLGSFIGWGNTPGQSIEGKVIAYGAYDGKTQQGEPVPEVTIELTEPGVSVNKLGERTEHGVGAHVVLTASQKNLQRGLKNANPSPGDLLKISLDKLVPSNGGTAKLFDIKILRNSPPAPPQAPPPAHTTVGAQSSFGGGFGDSEPPF